MFDRLTLHNFKAFKDLSLSLRPLTLLSGLNGSGKSTTLQALALLRQSWDTGYLSQRGFLLNGDLVSLGSGGDVLHEQHDDQMITIKLHRGHEELEWTAAYGASDDILPFAVPLEFGLFSNQEGQKGLFGHCFQYLRADRASPAVSFPKAYHLVSERRFLGSRGEFTAHFLHLHRDQEVTPSLRHPQETAPGLLSQVNAWLKDFSPGASIELEDIARTDTVRLDYFYGGRGGLSGSNAFRPTNVGFGLTYILPVLVACLASERGSWLLIESPEAHLHPQGQAIVGQLLAKSAAAGNKVIVESHSDHVLNGIRLAVKDGDIAADEVGLTFFKRGTGPGQPEHFQPQLTPAGRVTSWPDGFFDEWDKALDRLID